MPQQSHVDPTHMCFLNQVLVMVWCPFYQNTLVYDNVVNKLWDVWAKQMIISFIIQGLIIGNGSDEVGGSGGDCHDGGDEWWVMIRFEEVICVLLGAVFSKAVRVQRGWPFSDKLWP